MNPRFPVYIPSKGRADTRLTSKALERMGVPYYVVVEAQEHGQYAAVIDPSKILVLDPAYQREYDPFDSLGDSKPKGSGPARNFIWDHAVASGYDWHWVVDDNIRVFHRLNYNMKLRLLDGTCFYAMEDFCLRYENVALAGPNYQYFAKQRQPIGPLVFNTRIYSCILIRNDIPFRWRGRFNEDTDLSLRALKAGWCTVQFNAFLQDKIHTLTMRGGNTDTVYTEGTLPKSQQLADMHPDVARVVWKFNRWHHTVDYRPFRKNKLRLRPGVVVPQEPNEYGMRLVRDDDVCHELSREIGKEDAA